MKSHYLGAWRVLGPVPDREYPYKAPTFLGGDMSVGPIPALAAVWFCLYCNE